MISACRPASGPGGVVTQARKLHILIAVRTVKSGYLDSRHMVTVPPSVTIYDAVS